jgi:hypothetical protein
MKRALWCVSASLFAAFYASSLQLRVSQKWQAHEGLQ